jgi:hypothetical protein
MIVLLSIQEGNRLAPPIFVPYYERIITSGGPCTGPVMDRTPGQPSLMAFSTGSAAEIQGCVPGKNVSIKR